MRKASTRATTAFVHLGLILGSVTGRAEIVDAPDRELEWWTIGSFSGAAPSGWVSRINNWLFEYEGDDSLFQDLGDVSIGFGGEIGDLDIDWDNYFNRRVIRAHEELPAGSRIDADDLSLYKSISTMQTRLRFTWDYLPEVIGELGVGMELEGGFTLGTARNQESRLSSEKAFIPFSRGRPRYELREFFREQELSLDSDIIDLAFGSLAAGVDLGAGEFGERYADTEKAALFYENYSEPITYLTQSHLPPPPELFTLEGSPMTVGDSLTFKTFAGVSPLRASLRKSGVRASYKMFRRYIRETTVQVLPQRHVLVRVRKLLWDGNELTPLKVRPELRFLVVLKLAYTFFEMRRDYFRETVSDITYQIDLEREQSRRFFETLMLEARRAQVRPYPMEVQIPGVETVRSEFRTGRTRNRRADLSFSSALRYRDRNITSIHDVETEDAELREIVRARTREARNPFRPQRTYRRRSVVTIQSDLQWRDKRVTEPGNPGDDFAATLDTTFAARRASGDDLRALGNNLQSILNLDSAPAELRSLYGASPDSEHELTFTLQLSLGPEQARRLEKVTEGQLWLSLAEMLLGPEHHEAWSSEDKRLFWKPTQKAFGRASSSERHISERYDEMRGYRRSRAKSLGFEPDIRSSRQLFIMASKTVSRFEAIQREIREGDCVGCLARVFGKGSDVVLLQALIVRFAGGVETGEVGYRVEIFTGEMQAPAVASNGVTYTYRHQRGPQVLEDVERLSSSAPRLRAGEMLLNISSDHPSSDNPTTAPCWKMRLYSDLIFDDAMRARVYLRDARARTDEILQVYTLDLGPAALVPQSPFMVARYRYEVPIPWSGDLTPDEGYTILVRVLNPAGFPVTEEQEILFELPVGWDEKVPSRCR